MLTAVELNGVILVYDPDLVYEPAEDTFLFLDTLDRKTFRGARILDMGCGTGILGIYFGREAKKVVFVDINPHATLFTELNCWLNDLRNCDVRLGILFKALRPGEVFDYALFNAPYLVEEPSDPEDLLEYSWSGVSTLRAFLEQFPRYITKAAFVAMNDQSFRLVKDVLDRYEYRILASKHFFFEEVMLLEVKSDRNRPKRSDH